MEELNKTGCFTNLAPASLTTLLQWLTFKRLSEHYTTKSTSYQGTTGFAQSESLDPISRWTLWNRSGCASGTASAGHGGHSAGCII
jgi:hypothetical protein